MRDYNCTRFGRAIPTYLYVLSISSLYSCLSDRGTSFVNHLFDVGKLMKHAILRHVIIH